MEDISAQLPELIATTCSHPLGSLQRSLGMAKIIRLIQQSDKLWKERSPEYEDALQTSWIYFCRNLCEASTGECYNPEKASVITWLNAYLKRRLQDNRIETEKQQRMRVFSQSYDNEKSDNLIENLPAPTQSYPILEEIKAWVKKDPAGKLRRTHIRDRPEINCQVLILRRLPPETHWESLAKEFHIPSTTLSSFYSRHCIKYLREFGKMQGYLSED